MAYTAIEVPKGTWVLVSAVSIGYQVRKSKDSRIWLYEGTTIPTDVPSLNLVQPFVMLGDDTEGTTAYQNRDYVANAGESLYIYSVGQSTVVVTGV